MPCPSCCDLDATLSQPAWRPGDIHMWAKDLLETASGDCPICGLIWRGLVHFAEKQKLDSILRYEYDKIDIQLANAERGSPLTVHAWNDDGNLLIVEFFVTLTTHRNAPWSQFSLADPVATSSGDASCFDCIRTWIVECEADHPECAEQRNPLLPTRVIDINPTSKGNKPFLWETNGARGRYTALSYVWGSQKSATKKPNLTTTTLNLARHKKHIPWHSLPNTIQDAMTTTLEVGMRYIWVDALAILQDDADDWARESSRMAEVYSNATLTVAATSAKHANEGIFKSRQGASDCIAVWPPPASHADRTPAVIPLDVPTQDADRSSSGRPDFHILARSSLYEGIFYLPLQTRGWALQEHLLSRRVIQYASEQLLWHCRSARAVESRRLMTPSFTYPGEASQAFKPMLLRFSLHDDATKTPEQKKDILMTLWNDLINHFSRRQLTQEQDKLPAMSGLAKQVQTLGNGLLGRYLAGMWETGLVYALTWTTTTTHESTADDRHTQKPRAYRAPSWSWASVDGPISLPLQDNMLKNAGLKCEVVDVHCELSTADPTGKLRSAYLILRGRCIEGTLKRRRCTSVKFEENSTSSSSSDGVLSLDYPNVECRDVYTDELDLNILDERTKIDNGIITTTTTSSSRPDAQGVKKGTTMSRLQSRFNRLLHRNSLTRISKPKRSNHQSKSDPASATIDIPSDTTLNMSSPASSSRQVYPIRVQCFLLGVESEARLKNFGEATALILVSSTTAPGAFERIGLCKGMPIRCFDNVDEQNVKIV